MALSVSGILLLSHILKAAATCYFPDGKTIPRQDTACGTGRNATCCGQGFACMSNNLCKLTEHVNGAGPGQSTYVRGSCTDQTWADPNCPTFCVTPSNSDFIGGGMGLAKCEDTSQDRYYCIDARTEPISTAELCSNSTYYIEFQGTPTTVTIIGIAASTSTSTSSLSTTTSSTSQPSEPAPSTTSSAAPTPSSSVISPPPPQSKGRDYSVAIGAGVGVPLGVIAIALLWIMYHRFHRSRVQSHGQPHNHSIDPPTDYAQPKLAPPGVELHARSSPLQSPPIAYHDRQEWVSAPAQELPAGK